MAETRAYLDHAATTPLRPEARAAMLPWLGERFGNPSGSHAVSRAARAAVDDAREVIGTALRCEPGDVVFCSGGTESDNLAVFGASRAGAGFDVGAPPGGADGRAAAGTVVCTAVEHHAVLDPVVALGGRVVGVDRTGRVDLDRLADALDASVRLVSVMLANNEVGTVQPLSDVARLVRELAPRAVLHTDAVQGFAWLGPEALDGADLVTVTGHKLGGPQGAGVLVARGGVDVRPLLLGGGQERQRRSGTHNVAAIAGLAAAVEATVAQRSATVERVAALRDRLADGIVAAVPAAVETVPRAHKVAASCHLCFDGPGDAGGGAGSRALDSEALLFLLDQAGVAASAASACASGALEPSHVLAAMGLSAAQAASALRLSLGWCSTEADVDLAVEAVAEAVGRLTGGRRPAATS